MKNTIFIFLLGFTSLNAQNNQDYFDEKEKLDSIKNSDKEICGCKCWPYMPKLKNKNNSPLFDSTEIQTRSWPVFKDKNSEINFMFSFDSIDYLWVSIHQHQFLRQRAVIHENQKFMIYFSDSSQYVFSAPNKFNAEVFKTSLNSSYQIDEFRIPFTDSLKNLVLGKSILGIWISNQNSTVNISDRFFECVNPKNPILHRMYCCYDLNKKRQIK